MPDKNDQLKKPNETFRFSSGQVLALDEHQIVTIPYLAALVSSADRFDSPRDEHGHYKLDPNINYQHFSLILQSLPFYSARQVFTCLPEEESVIPIVALLDFLGLLPYLLPSLEEVDSTFFCTLIYSPYRDKYLHIVKKDVLQDMAVRFAIAMIKEEYEFDQCQVMDQIYWFVMFILSAHEWFDPRLRQHVYKTARNCFALFKPTFLKPLEELVSAPRMQIKKYPYVWYKENDLRLLSIRDLLTIILDELDEDSPERPSFYFNFRRRRRSYYLSEERYWIPTIENFNDKDPLELIYCRALDIMCVRLQAEVCQSARAELQQRKNLYKFVQRRTDVPVFFRLVEHEILPRKIDEIFKRQQVQEEIDALILQDICSLTPKIESEYAKLVKLLREYEETSGTFNQYDLYWHLWTSPYFSTSERARKKALSYELFLDKLHKNSYDTVEQIRRRVLIALNKVALKQFNQWERTQREIDKLESELNRYQQLDLCCHIEKKRKNTCQQHPSTSYKPFVNHHFKRSIR